MRASQGNLKRGVIRLRNVQHFAGISWLRARYEITIDGEIVQHGALRLPDIAAGESETVEIAGLNPEAAPGEEAFLTVYFETAIDLGWAPKGFPVGWQQVALPTRRKRRAPRENTNGERTEVDFDTDGGLLTAIRFDGQTLLTTPPVLSLWRAPTDNDGLKLAPNQELKPLGRWRTWGLEHVTRARRPRPQQADVRRPRDDRARALRRRRRRHRDPAEHDVPLRRQRRRHHHRGHPRPEGARRPPAPRLRVRAPAPRSNSSSGSAAVRTSRIPTASSAPRSVATSRPSPTSTSPT